MKTNRRKFLKTSAATAAGFQIVPRHVIGGQGHLFGRGNQQFSPAVIRRLGKANIEILASRTKLGTLEGRPLVVDTGDPELDRDLCGLWPITSGYDDTLLYRVATDAG